MRWRVGGGSVSLQKNAPIALETLILIVVSCRKCIYQWLAKFPTNIYQLCMDLCAFYLYYIQYIVNDCQMSLSQCTDGCNLLGISAWCISTGDARLRVFSQETINLWCFAPYPSTSPGGGAVPRMSLCHLWRWLSDQICIPQLSSEPQPEAGILRFLCQLSSSS